MTLQLVIDRARMKQVYTVFRVMLMIDFNLSIIIEYYFTDKAYEPMHF